MIVFGANVLVLFSIAFLLWKKETVLKPYFWPALAVKIFAGIAIGLVYTYYYGLGDTLDYFIQAKQLTTYAGRNFGDYLRFLVTSDFPVTGLDSLREYPPRALFFSKCASIVALITGDNYWLTTCYFSLISFISSWFLVKKLSVIFPRYTMRFVFAILFFPSVVLWTSGLIKESLAMAALFLIVMLFLRVWSGERLSLSHWVVLVAAFWILWNLKYYFLAVLIPVLCTELLMKRIIAPRWRLNGPGYVLLWLAILIAPAALMSMLHPNLHVGRVLEVIVTNHDLFVAMSDPAEIIHYNSLKPEFGSVLANLPIALTAGLFRPFIWEITNPLQLLAAMENVFVLVLMVAFVGSLIHKKQHPSGLWFAAICYSLLLCTFLALSTPNLGTLSRFKVGFLPILMLALLCSNPWIDRILEPLERKLQHFV
jgi:hypothetical protein